MSTREDKDIAIPLNVGAEDRVFNEADPTERLLISAGVRSDSTPQGMLEKMPQVVSRAVTSQAYGLIPVGDQDCAILYNRPKTGQRKITDLGANLNEPYSTEKGIRGQNGYVPLQVIDSGVLPGAQDLAPISVIRNEGRTWFVNRRFLGAALGTRLYVSVVDDDGVIRVGGQFLLAQSGVNAFTNFVALTGHGSSGVVLWYREALGPISAVNLLLNTTTNQVTLGTVGALWTPHETEHTKVVGGGLTSAWVISRGPTSGADTVVQVSRVTISAGAPAVAATQLLAGWNQTAGPGANNIFAISYLGDSANPRIAVAGSHTTQTTFNNIAVLDASSMAVVWAQVFLLNATMNASRLAVAFGGNAADGELCVWTVFSEISGIARTVFEVRRLSTGAAVGAYDATNGSMVLLNFATATETHGTWYLAPTEAVPLFIMRKTPATSDPAMHVILGKTMADDSHVYTPIARFAVDESFGNVSMHASGTPEGGVTIGEQRLTLAYQTITSGVSANVVNRYLEIDLRPRPTPWVDDTGSPLIVAAMPAYFDGVETVEYGPLHMPTVIAGPAAPSGPGLTGTYYVRAVFSRIDSSGKRRRSMASDLVSVAPAGQAILATVYKPFSMLQDSTQGRWLCQLYVTRWNGTSASADYYLRMVSDDPSNGLYTFQWETEATDTSPLLFSTGQSGEELPPQCPPALFAACAWEDRILAIKAEDRASLLVSKPRAVNTGNDNIAVEFSTLLRQPFPVDAGKLVNVASANGQPIVLAEKGVFTLDGPGWDQFLGGLGYVPRRIAKRGCCSRDSVLVTEAGILFLTDTQDDNGSRARRMAILTDGVRVFDGNTISGNSVIGAFAWEQRCEAVFLFGTETEGTGMLVYNWKTGGWSSWVAGSGIISAAPSVIAKVAAQAIMVGPTSFLTVAQSGTYHAANWSLRTRWIAPAQEHGDCEIREVWFSGVRVADHGITISLGFDYEGTSTQTKTWTAAQVAAAADASGRYTLAMDITKKSVRSVRIQLSETGSTGNTSKPLTVTVFFDAKPGPARARIKKSGRK